MEILNPINTILFDLDGTLVDTKSVIIDSANNMLKSLGFEKLTAKEIIRHIKFDTAYLVRMLTGLKESEEIKKGVEIFTNHWKEHVETDVNLFEGVEDTLDYLKDRELAITSNGIRVVIEKTLERFKIRHFFKYIISGDDPDCIKPTACQINKAFDVFNSSGFAKKDQVIIVGDTVSDIRAGKEGGIKTCAVTYGIGTLKDIKAERPDFIIDSITELKKIV